MTDQAETQSGDAQQATPVTMRELLKQTFSGGNPEGQAQSENVTGDTQQSDAPQADQLPAKFRVPALEGDGYEELTPEELKAQRLMQKDYTRKTQEVAEERKRIAELKQATEAEAQRRIDKLENDLTVTARLIQSFDAQVDWDRLEAEDPAMYLMEKRKQAQRIQAWEHARHEAESLKAEQRKARRAQEAERLVQAIPDWLDADRARNDAQKLIEGASQYGLTAADIDNFDDHRLVLMLRDAIRLRELEAKKSTVTEQVQKAPVLAKPGAVNNGNPQALAVHRAIKKVDGSRDSLRNLFKATLNP
jgi:hypothetical protein